MLSVGGRWFSFLFTFLLVEVKMIEDFITFVSLGFLVGMIITMGCM